MAYETILCEKKDRLAYITLNRPQVLNAINARMREELTHAFTALGADDEVRAVLVTGAGGRAFSAGADIKDPQFTAASPVEMRRFRTRYNYGRLIYELEKPVIAAINGYALGGGLELALWCDIRIAAENARLGVPEVRVGRFPGGGGTQLLPRLVGRGQAMLMILTGEPIDAREAYRIGLVDLVVPLPELLPTAEKVARSILAQAPVAVRYAKEAANKGLGTSLDAGLRLENDLSMLLLTTEDRLEGARAFAEKRPPAFKGR